VGAMIHGVLNENERVVLGALNVELRVVYINDLRGSWVYVLVPSKSVIESLIRVLPIAFFDLQVPFVLLQPA